MGYCSPNYRLSVDEVEKRISQKGNDTIPLRLKLVIVSITILTASIIILLG